MVFILLILSFITRFFAFGYPSQVVFDEVHSGNFISNYWHGTYFFDVHPPFSKLIFLLFSHIIGATPDADFTTIGNALPPSYILLRLIPSILGVLLPILIYYICRRLDFDKVVSSLASLIVIFENSLIVQSRFVLFDVFVLFFGFSALLTYLIYAQRIKKDSRLISFGLIALSAFFASASFGTKWTGLSFALIVVVLEFLRIFTHNNISSFSFRTSFTKANWREYILFKIVFVLVFSLIYIGSFFIHFSLLPNSGPGDNYMSERFQNSLSGSKLPKPFAFIDGKLTQTNAMNLLQKTAELNTVMLDANVNFGSTHPYSSKWYSWPLMLRSIYYWHSDSHYIYLIGNPFAYWFGAISVLVLIVYFAYLFLRHIFSKKGFADQLNDFALLFIVVGFVANFLPFSTIGRVMFLYHYEPALIFGIMALAYIMNMIRQKSYFYPAVFVIVLSVVLLFVYFAPLTYGLALSDAGIMSRMWLPGWR